MWGESKREIAHAKRSHHAGQVLFDESDAFDGFNGGVDKFLVACSEGEGQRVVDQIFGLEPVVVDGEPG